jgi:hypothetical protein
MEPVHAELRGRSKDLLVGTEGSPCPRNFGRLCSDSSQPPGVAVTDMWARGFIGRPFTAARHR